MRIFDPRYAATGILSESFVKGDKEKLLKWITVYRNVILGYDSVAKLTREERKAIPYVVLSIQLIFIAWCEGQEEIKDIFETNMEMTRWVIENFEKLKIDD